jgi:hypothetical protein
MMSQPEDSNVHTYTFATNNKHEIAQNFDVLSDKFNVDRNQLFEKTK